MLRWVRDIMLGELAGGSLILPHHGSEFTHSDLLHLHSPSARASAMDAFVNCDKTFIWDLESPSYA